MHRAMSSSFGCSVWRNKRQRCNTYSSSSWVNSLCWIHYPLPHPKTLPQIPKTFIFSMNMLWKTTCSFWKMQNAVWQQIKLICLFVVDNEHASRQRKRCSPQTSSIHSKCITCREWIALSHQMLFSTNFISKQHARLVQSPKTSNHSSTVNVVPPFCSKFRAVHK